MTLKGRGPVENLNRQRKAKMIEAFLKDTIDRDVANFKILDIGCGNGQISNYFAESNDVCGVDVEDKRSDKSSKFDFTLIKDELLPFADSNFDIVISHHVIEHVKNQQLHLAEMLRVLKSDGVAYLGCPNKGSPFMAGHKGNDIVLRRNEAIMLIEEGDASWEDYYYKLLTEPEKYYCEISIGKYLPKIFIRAVKNWYPGLCFILRKN